MVVKQADWYLILNQDRGLLESHEMVVQIVHPLLYLLFFLAFWNQIVLHLKIFHGYRLQSSRVYKGVACLLVVTFSWQQKSMVFPLRTSLHDVV